MGPKFDPVTARRSVLCRRHVGTFPPHVLPPHCGFVNLVARLEDLYPGFRRNLAKQSAGGTGFAFIVHIARMTGTDTNICGDFFVRGATRTFSAVVMYGSSVLPANPKRGWHIHVLIRIVKGLNGCFSYHASAMLLPAHFHEPSPVSASRVRIQWPTRTCFEKTSSRRTSMNGASIVVPFRGASCATLDKSRAHCASNRNVARRARLSCGAILHRTNSRDAAGHSLGTSRFGYSRSDERVASLAPR